MKNLILLLAITVSFFSYSQDSLNGNVVIDKVKVTDISVSMVTDNIDEIYDFEPSDLKDAFEIVDINEKLVFKLKYEYPDSIIDGKAIKSFSLQAEGSSSDVESFIRNLESLKAAAIDVITKKQ